MVTTLDFQTAMTELERHPDNLRIKKLLWTVLYQYWENDTNRLRAVTIEYLVEELQKYYPNLEDLASALYGLVNTLNKKAEYGRVANIVIQYLTTTYSVTQIELPTNIAASGATSQNKAFEELGEGIAQHEQSNYIKQLLQLVCSSHLDKSPQQIRQKEIVSLIKELYRLAPDLDELQFLLLDAVKSLDQKKEYIWAADALSEIMWKLYETPIEAPDPSGFELSSTPTAPATPYIVQASAPAPPAPPGEQNLAETTLTGVPPESAQSNQAIDLKDTLYTIRLDIINRTNPLRAKILLFSALYNPFGFSTQHWLELKTKNLNFMLTELLERYQDFNAMEDFLLKTARNLQDANENTKAAKAIMQGLRRLQKT